MITLKPIFAPMKFADTVRNYHDGVGERFDFIDRTGHIHGEYRKGCAISPAPDAALGAVKIGEAWFWVIRDVNVSDQRPGDRDATKNKSSGIAGFAASDG